MKNLTCPVDPSEHASFAGEVIRKANLHPVELCRRNVEPRAAVREKQILKAILRLEALRVLEVADGELVVAFVGRCELHCDVDHLQGLR